MKTTTPFFLIIICLFFVGCGEDERLGSHLDQVKYYDFIYTGSGYYGETKFFYDEQGRINHTTGTNTLGHNFLTEYTYADNQVTVSEFGESSESVEKTLSLKFENEQLVEFVVSHELADQTATATVNFLYEAGKLTAIQFEGDTYEVEVNEAGNIVRLQNAEFSLTPEYDNNVNPFYGMPLNFVNLSYGNGPGNRLFLGNFIKYFSPNNQVADRFDYKYQDGKVTELKETINGTWTKIKLSYKNQ